MNTSLINLTETEASNKKSCSHDKRRCGVNNRNCVSTDHLPPDDLVELAEDSLLSKKTTK